MISSLSVSLWYIVYISSFLLGRTLLFRALEPLSFHRNSFIPFHQADLGQLTHVTECKQGLFLSSQLLRFLHVQKATLLGLSSRLRSEKAHPARRTLFILDVCLCCLFVVGFQAS